MFGPTSTTMMVPLDSADLQAAYQQHALNLAAMILNSSGTINSYYSGSWIAITTITLSGDIVEINPFPSGIEIPHAGDTNNKTVISPTRDTTTSTSFTEITNPTGRGVIPSSSLEALMCAIIIVGYLCN